MKLEGKKQTNRSKYVYLLNDIIINIQKKIKKSKKKNELPLLCPIECVILLYILGVCRNGVYRKISIMEVYSIMECYDKCSDLINEIHLKTNKCLCNRFNGGTKTKSIYQDIRKSIVNHYEIQQLSEKIYVNYAKMIDEIIGKNLSYNQYISLFYTPKDNDINNFTLCEQYELDQITLIIVCVTYLLLNLTN